MSDDEPQLPVRMIEGQRIQTATMPAAWHRRWHLGLLHKHNPGLVEIAAGPRLADGTWRPRRSEPDSYLPGGAAGQAAWLKAATAKVQQHVDAGHDISISPAWRSEPSGRQEAVSGGTWLWSDIDDPISDWPTATRRWINRHPPAVIVASSRERRHLYWRLAEPVDATSLRDLQLRLTDALGHDEPGADGTTRRGADPVAGRYGAVMRLAGTENHKYRLAGNTPVWTRIHTINRDAEPLDTTELPELPAPTVPPPSRPLRRPGRQWNGPLDPRQWDLDALPDSRQITAAVSAVEALEQWAPQLLDDGRRESDGVRMRCLSPDHDDHRPSMLVYDRPGGGAHCYACGANLSVLDLWAIAHGHAPSDLRGALYPQAIVETLHLFGLLPPPTQRRPARR